MNVMISWVLAILIIVAGIGIVTISTGPTLDRARAATDLNSAEQSAALLEKSITDVAREGIGSSRVLSLKSSEGAWSLSPNENAIEFRLQSSPLEAGGRRVKGNLAYISGFDANCSSGTYGGSPAWIMENNYLRAYVQRVNGTLNTAQNILALQSKVTGVSVVPTDSSVLIDNVAASSSGTGFSEMLTGTGMPICQAHFFVNSTTGLSYDIFYTLYSAADFITVEVANIG